MIAGYLRQKAYSCSRYIIAFLPMNLLCRSINIKIDRKRTLCSTNNYIGIRTMISFVIAVKDSFLTEQEVHELGFKELGRNVKISRKASIYGPGDMCIGDNVRVDDFCILSGRLSIGSYIHISAYVALYGQYGIVLKDFVALSARTLVYSGTDDYSGNFLTNPTVPSEYRNVINGMVRFEKHSILGAGCIVLPGVTIGEGCAVGAGSLVNKSLEPWMIYVGVPCHPIKERQKRLLMLEEELKRT
jgi:acetyltransferase-like isoleucine patch superfamily enzyme